MTRARRTNPRLPPTATGRGVVAGWLGLAPVLLAVWWGPDRLPPESGAGRADQALAAGQDPGPITVRVDPRVELFATLFRMGGRDEYHLTQAHRWGEAVDAAFAPFEDHPAVVMTRRLAGRYGVGFFVPMNLAVHLGDLPELEERTPLDASTSIHRTWTTFPDTTAAYLELVRAFAREADFDGFLTRHASLIDSTEVRIRRLVAREIDVPWFSNFWGAEPAERFILVPGLINGRASYGVSYANSRGPDEIYAITGVTDVDGAGIPTFGSDYAATVVHEFNHAFVDDMVAAHADEYREFGDRLYETHAEAMRAQRYGSWESMVREYLVRSAVVRYRFDHEGAAAAEAEIAEQDELGWRYIRPLADLLETLRAAGDCTIAECGSDALVAFFRERASEGGARR